MFVTFHNFYYYEIRSGGFTIMRINKSGFIFTMCLLSVFQVQATIIQVPLDQPTIQAGIDVAVDTDTVLVADGTYIGSGNKDIRFNGKAITVVSENGPLNCIIDCENTGRGFIFDNGEGLDSVVEGFTITNGETSGDGAGIFCDRAAATILNCRFISNLADDWGGGIACIIDAAAEIRDCCFYDNAGSFGGGIANFGIDSGMTVTNCIFESNRTWTTFSNGYGGGIFSSSVGVSIEQCTFTDNQASDGGAILCQYDILINLCDFSK